MSVGKTFFFKHTFTEVIRNIDPKIKAKLSDPQIFWRMNSIVRFSLMHYFIPGLGIIRINKKKPLVSALPEESLNHVQFIFRSESELTKNEKNQQESIIFHFFYLLLFSSGMSKMKWKYNQCYPNNSFTSLNIDV